MYAAYDAQSSPLQLLHACSEICNQVCVHLSQQSVCEVKIPMHGSECTLAFAVFPGAAVGSHPLNSCTVQFSSSRQVPCGLHTHLHSHVSKLVNDMSCSLRHPGHETCLPLQRCSSFSPCWSEWHFQIAASLGAVNASHSSPQTTATARLWAHPERMYMPWLSAALFTAATLRKQPSWSLTLNAIADPRLLLSAGPWMRINGAPAVHH